MGDIFWKGIVPSILYNEDHRRGKGQRFTDKKECLEALASGKWWKSWKGPDQEVEDWAAKKLGRNIPEDDPDLPPDPSVVQPEKGGPEKKKEPEKAKIIGKPGKKG